MPNSGGSGRSAKDRSIFGFRKLDKLSTRPGTWGGHWNEASDDQKPPAIPPLETLHSDNSFANLLIHLEHSQISSTGPAVSPNSVLSSPALVSKESASSSCETLKQDYAQVPQSTNAMAVMAAGSDYSTLADSQFDEISEPRQSSTSMTSISDQSDSSSAATASSRSSVEDLPEKGSLHTLPAGQGSSSIDVGFLMDSFRDVDLDLQLTRNQTLQPSQPSSPILNTNKPLPPAPSQSPHYLQSDIQRFPIPELDSLPIPDTNRGSKKILIEDVVQQISDPSVKSRSQAVKAAEMLPCNNIDLHVHVAVPRRNSARIRSKDSTSNGTKRTKVNLDSAEQPLLRIMVHLSSLPDLQAVAMVNKAFYRVFKSRETQIVESVLRTSSPPAWELRQLIKHEQKKNPFHIKSVQRDLNALRTLESFMVMRCNRICRKNTIEAMVGNDTLRRQSIENALWRIWTFCKLFGKGTSNDAGVSNQILWLEGKAMHDKRDSSKLKNIRAVSAVTLPELEDISEMWRCMEMLLSGFRGRELEALEAGIFDQCKQDDRKKKDHAEYLEEWICDILSVGPKAVLTMISCSFEHAKVLGVNKWSPPRSGRSRRTFLKGALEQVYRDLLVDEARLKAEDFAKSIQHQAPKSKPFSKSVTTAKRTLSISSKYRTSHSSSYSDPTEHLRLCTQHEEMDVREDKHLRLEIRPDCDPESPIMKHEQQLPIISPTTNPASYSSIAMMSNASARIGATLFPIQRAVFTGPHTSQHPAAEDNFDEIVQFDRRAKVVDPSDRAISLLVKQLGFPESLAKQALAMSDDGSGIDVNRAVELLTEDRRLATAHGNVRTSESSNSLPSFKPAVQQFKDYCEGTRRRVSLINRKSSHLRGLMSRASFRQGAGLGVILDNEEEGGATTHPAKTVTMPRVSGPMPAVLEYSAIPNGAYNHMNRILEYRSGIGSPAVSREQIDFRKGHKKSTSTGTINLSGDTEKQAVSPISPQSSFDNVVTMRTLSLQTPEYYEKEVAQHNSTKPNFTLTRIGTETRPNNRFSLSGWRTVTVGRQPEIIGYSY